MRFPEGSWRVVEIAIAGELVPPLKGRGPLSLDVADGKVAGNAGVNRFFGTVGDDGRPGPLATTMMAGPPDLMAQEQLYLGFLDSFDDIQTHDQGINLLRDDVVVVALVPSDLPEGNQT